MIYLLVFIPWSPPAGAPGAPVIFLISTSDTRAITARGYSLGFICNLIIILQGGPPCPEGAPYCLTDSFSYFYPLVAPCGGSRGPCCFNYFSCSDTPPPCPEGAGATLWVSMFPFWDLWIYTFPFWDLYLRVYPPKVCPPPEEGRKSSGRRGEGSRGRREEPHPAVIINTRYFVLIIN